MSQLARNTFLLTAASIGQKAIAFLYFAFIARTIGDAATGSYFLALGLTTTIGVLDDLGLTSVLIREVARTPERAREHVRAIIGIKLFTMPLTIILAFILPTFLGFDAEAALLTRYAVIIMLLDTVSLSLYGALRGLQILKFEAIGIFIGQALTTTFGVLALLSGFTDLRLLIAALITGSFWNALFSLFQVVRRLGLQTLTPSYAAGLAPLRASVMFFLAAIFVKVYSYVDSLTLNMVLGKAAVGVYAVAYKLTYAFQFLPLAFIGALYPTMSAQAGDTEELKKTFLQAEWYLALLASPIVFGLFALAPEIIGFFYGHQFAAAASTLEILVFALLFIFLDFPVGSLLNATGRQATKTAIMGATMVINIVANLALVPVLGIPGAGVSALLSFSFMFLAGFLCIRKAIDVSFYDIMMFTGGSIASGGIMAAGVLLLKQVIPWMVTVPLGALIFFASAFLTRSLTVDHLRTLWKLVPVLKPRSEDEEVSDV